MEKEANEKRCEKEASGGEFWRPVGVIFGFQEGKMESEKHEKKGKVLEERPGAS